MAEITKWRKSCSMAARVAAFAACACVASFAVAQAEDEVDEGPALYQVEDGKVDPGTYEGYLVFTRMCQACHGPDALGSSFAPSLVRAAERRTFVEFARTIAEGRDIQPGRVMPSFADDAYVMGNVQNIWSYLNARADGALGRGRPQVIEEAEN